MSATAEDGIVQQRRMRSQVARRLRAILAEGRAAQRAIGDLQRQREQLFKVFEALEGQSGGSVGAPHEIREAAERHLQALDAEVEAARGRRGAIAKEERELRDLLEALLEMEAAPLPRGIPPRNPGTPAHLRRVALEDEQQRLCRAIMAALAVEPGLTGVDIVNRLGVAGVGGSSGSSLVIPVISQMYQRDVIRRGGHKSWYLVELDDDDQGA